MGLGIPQITKFMKAFKGKGNDVKDDILTIEEAKEEILNYLRSKKDA
jgi:energy-coupling factor transport system ATP-binding protein